MQISDLELNVIGGPYQMMSFLGQIGRLEINPC